MSWFLTLYICICSHGRYSKCVTWKTRWKKYLRWYRVGKIQKNRWKNWVIHLRDQQCNKGISGGGKGKREERQRWPTLWLLYSVVQACLTLCDPMDCSPPGSSVHGIFQARILEWVAIIVPQGVFPTQGSNPCLLHRQEPPGKPSLVDRWWENCHHTTPIVSVSVKLRVYKSRAYMTIWGDVCGAATLRVHTQGSAILISVLELSKIFFF